MSEKTNGLLNDLLADLHWIRTDYCLELYYSDYLHIPLLRISSDGKLERCAVTGYERSSGMEMDVLHVEYLKDAGIKLDENNKWEMVV